MQRNERLELAKLIRLRAKVAKDDVDQRLARLLADLEGQLLAYYPDNHEAWKDITQEVKERIKTADAMVAERCRQLKIPERFRPTINWWWSGSGENGLKERRAELRKLAQVRLTACAKAAKVQIDRQSANLQTRLAADGLETEDAKAFLEQMPSVEALMPPVALKELELIEQ